MTSSRRLAGFAFLLHHEIKGYNEEECFEKLIARALRCNNKNAKPANRRELVIFEKF